MQRKPEVETLGRRVNLLGLPAPSDKPATPAATLAGGIDYSGNQISARSSGPLEGIRANHNETLLRDGRTFMV